MRRRHGERGQRPVRVRATPRRDYDWGAASREQTELHAAAGNFAQALDTHKLFHAEVLAITSDKRQTAARTQAALLGTAEAREDARQLQRQARMDALTGLPNRPFVTEELPIRLNDASAGVPLVVAVVDADSFKLINDALSHEVGDTVIRELGRVLEAALPAAHRATDESSGFLARLGGDEFLVVLPGLNLPAAIEVLEAMRASVASHPWRPIIGDLALTVSVGAVAASAHDTPAEILARADRNLYAAKKAGRDRVEAGLR